MTPVVVSVTAAGRDVADRIAGEHVHGDLAATVRDQWMTAEAFVLVVAVGAAVRVIAPLLTDKHTDPPVVCIDDAGRWVVPVAGGHAGANDLARAIADRIGASAVITTATDGRRVPALDALPGVTATGDVAGVQRALLDGDDVELIIAPEVSGYRPAIVVTDRTVRPRPATAVLHPRSLVVGIGTSSDAPTAEVAALVARALDDAGLAPASVAEVATIDRRRDEPAVVALDWPVRTFPADELRTVDIPTPSAVVDAAVGTPSVCEAAALLAAGPGGELVVAKQTSAHATVAIARRARPRGRLAVVGIGPGAPEQRTAAATTALETAEVVIGYDGYVAACADLLTPAQERITSPIGDEITRAKQAVAEADSGRRVALVGSGDAGVYALATLVFEVAGTGPLDFDVEVVPGVTAATAAAALLGAPLGHDHAAVSLSDLLTPWSVIESRLRAVAEADFVVSLYNPRSRGRPDHLERARRILLARRTPSTPVGVVTDAYRPGQRVELTTLGDLDPERVGMTTIVVVGASTTRVTAGRMVTPRGYQP